VSDKSEEAASVNDIKHLNSREWKLHTCFTGKPTISHPIQLVKCKSSDLSAGTEYLVAKDPLAGYISSL